MKKFFAGILSVLFAVSGMHANVAAEPDVFVVQGRDTLFNDGWMFQRLEADASPTEVTLPHDWSIQEDYSTDYEAESGFLPGGSAIYTRELVLPESLQGKRVVLEFEGVSMNAEVSVNGRQLGTHPYGYTSFAFDLTQDLIMDGITSNQIEVAVTNQIPSSRWYSGSGIYRDVHLIVTDPVHIERNGITIEAPDLSSSSGRTELKVKAVNQSQTDSIVSLHTTVFDPEGHQVSEVMSEPIRMDSEQETVLHQEVMVEEPRLWSLSDPVRYRFETELVEADGTVLDHVETLFGYRYFSFDSNTGFSLNGEPVKLKGVCLHHDLGALGAASVKAAWSYRLDLLREMGVNAIRIAHNPADSTLLELCDEMGILVVEEAFDTWSNNKNYNWNDYGSIFLETIEKDNEILDGQAGMTWAEFDIKAMTAHSLNHPSVILYSIGNEILGNIGGDTSAYPLYAEQLISWIQEISDSRPVTIADNMTLNETEIQLALDSAVDQEGGVVGLNYATAESMDHLHEVYSDWKLFGSETASAYGSRSEYGTSGIDESRHQITAYDRESVEWGTTASQAWKETIERDYIAGEFVWTGFDYIGEPEPWNGLEPGSVTDGSPAPNSSYFGILDTAGLKKDSYYFYQSQWREDITVAHILPDWQEGNLKRSLLGKVDVDVYTNAPAIELFLNGASLGRKTAETHETPAGYQYQTYEGELVPHWKVSYHEGTLEVVAYDEDGSVLEVDSGRTQVHSAGDPVSILLTADHGTLRDKTDVIYVRADLLDSSGTIVSASDSELEFQLNGAGTILGADNGDPTDCQRYQDTDGHTITQRSFHGSAVVLVGGTNEAGEVTLRVSGEGLSEAVIHLSAGRKRSNGLFARMITAVQQMGGQQ